MPPRRQPPTKAESKTGLVVALVFFILTTIGTGTAAYLGFDGQKEYDKKCRTSQAEKTKAMNEAAEARAALLADDMMIGLTKANEADIRGSVNNKAFTDRVYTLSERFKAVGVEWTREAQASGQLPETVVSMMEKLQAAKLAAENNLNSSLVNQETTNKRAKDAEATADAIKKSALAKQKEALDGQTKAQQAEQDARKANFEKINDLALELSVAKRDKETSDAEKLLQLKKTNERLAVEKAANDKLEREREAKRQVLTLKDTPRGAVTRVDGDTGTAIINLGSADAVRPSLTFSILLPVDLSTLNEDSVLPKKATIEVQQVLTEHSSRAVIRYADDVNSVKNPVEAGDKLYKPGWNKGQPVPVAIIGHIDLDGYGTDETALLARRLEKQGVVVQAYFDLATLKWVGNFNQEIEFLILGDLPTAATFRSIGEDRARLIESKIVQELEKARSQHIMVYRARQFLPAAGIDLPRNPLPPKFPVSSSTEPAGKAKDEGK